MNVEVMNKYSELYVCIHYYRGGGSWKCCGDKKTSAVTAKPTQRHN